MRQKIGPQLHIIQKMAKGTNVTGLRTDEMTEDQVDVTQEIGVAKNVTGDEIKNIGQ